MVIRSGNIITGVTVGLISRKKTGTVVIPTYHTRLLWGNNTLVRWGSSTDVQWDVAPTPSP